MITMKFMQKKKIKKVIFIGYAPLTVHTEKNFYFNEILDQGLQLQYWNLTNHFFPYLTLPDTIQRDYIIEIQNIVELKKKLKLESIDELLIIPIIGFEWRSLYLYYLLNSLNCRLGFFARGMLPIYNVNVKTKIASKLYALIRPNEMWRLILNQVAYFIRKKSTIGHFEVVFSAGAIAEKNYQALTDCIIRCNHFDYDDTLAAEKKNSLISHKYIVFLDEFLCGHPDFKMLNAKTISGKSYFSTMNTFFKKIEEILELEVIIASHPKADYSAETFAGRKIIKYQTPKLVQNSELVIAHVSTSIGLGVIYKKPILLTYTQELEDIHSMYIGFIKNFGSALKCQVVNIDHFLLQKEFINLRELDINIEQYNLYLKKYLTSNESQYMHTKQIFLKYLTQCGTEE